MGGRQAESTVGMAAAIVRFFRHAVDTVGELRVARKPGGREETDVVLGKNTHVRTTGDGAVLSANVVGLPPHFGARRPGSRIDVCESRRFSLW